MSPDDRIRITFHFQERHWFEDGPDNPPPNGNRQIGRSIELDVHPNQSLVGFINLHIAENPGDFPKFQTVDGHREVDLVLIRPAVATEDWRFDWERDTTGIDLVIGPYSEAVQWLNFDNDWERTLATPDTVRAAIDAGLLDGKRDEFVVFVHYPSGGDWGWWPEVGEWLFDQGVDLGLEPVKAWIAYKVGSIFTKYIRNGRRARRARRIARDWENRGLTAPFQLRTFVDLKRTWTPAELGKRLAVQPAVGQQILKALGYEPDAGGVWRLGTRRKAIKRRARWMAREHTGDPRNSAYDSDEDSP